MEVKMKIGLLSWIIDRKRTGVDNYLYNLINSFIKEGKSQHMSLIHYNKTSDPVYTKVHDVIIPTFGPSKFTKIFGMPYAIKKEGIDILHVPMHWPTQILSFFFNYNVKKILTIHDITPLLIPETHTAETKRWWLSSLNLIKNRADIIITDSSNTKKDCVKYLDIPKDRIRVIHLAADPMYKPFKNKETAIKDLNNNYNLNLPFILAVGTLEKRKNIPTLIRAFNQLKKKGIKHKLVLIGGKGWKYNEIFHTIDKLNLKEEVLFMGYVPDEDLVKFYNTADLFVYPSIYEGFGLPPLEAMACGCPVVTSNSSSLPEVVGDAGIMVDPYNSDDLADKIYEILNNRNLRAKLCNKSLKRAKMFNWEKTARETWKVYEEVFEKE